MQSLLEIRLFWFYFETGSHCSPHCPWMLSNSPTSLSWVLGVQACATMSWATRCLWKTSTRLTYPMNKVSGQAGYRDLSQNKTNLFGHRYFQSSLDQIFQRILNILRNSEILDYFILTKTFSTQLSQQKVKKFIFWCHFCWHFIYTPVFPEMSDK